MALQLLVTLHPSLSPWLKGFLQLGVAVHMCNPRAGEARAEGLKNEVSPALGKIALNGETRDQSVLAFYRKASEKKPVT